MAKKPVAAPETTPPGVRVAYHDGPPEIHFGGLAWRRGVADTITADKWAEMRSRGDFHEFDFREEAPREEQQGD